MLVVSNSIGFQAYDCKTAETKPFWERKLLRGQYLSYKLEVR